MIHMQTLLELFFLTIRNILMHFSAVFCWLLRDTVAGQLSIRVPKMEGVRTFLESSTIHGLTYISTNRRLVRFFWIIVVISGFATAGALIYQSFQNWEENPVTTTIETLLIKEASYPKITVCPPKGTLTDLNHDLMTLGNITVHVNGTMTIKHFHQKDFETTLNKINDFKERDRYRNWYSGFSRIPIYIRTGYISVYGKTIETHALSGEISTPFFGDKFDTNNFDLDATFTVKFYNPYKPSHSNYFQ